MAPTSRHQVYRVLDEERDFQDAAPHSACPKAPNDFLVYMQDYLREAMELSTRDRSPDTKEKILHIIRKITAMGIACMEQNGAPRRGS